MRCIQPYYGNLHQVPEQQPSMNLISLGAQRQQQHKDPTFWLKGPRQGGSQKPSGFQVPCIDLFTKSHMPFTVYYVLYTADYLPCSVYHILSAMFYISCTVYYVLYSMPAIPYLTCTIHHVCRFWGLNEALKPRSSTLTWSPPTPSISWSGWRRRVRPGR